MDVWLTVCYLTVFISVFEYCTVIYLTKRAFWEELLDQRRKIGVLKKTNPQASFEVYYVSVSQKLVILGFSPQIFFILTSVTSDTS